MESREEVARRRYYENPSSSWKKLSNRVAKGIAVSENSKQEEWRMWFYDIISTYKFVPGGRILRNAGVGTSRNLLNCFVLPIDDNIESIGQCMKDALITWSGGGGVGINFSNLRPKGSVIKGKGGESSGLVSFMTALNSVANTIRVGGQRRAATIAIVDVSHPEIEEFIDAKLKHGRLNCFNISVGISNEFLEAVERDADWDLIFRKKTYKTVKARKLWNRILSNMVQCAEPGLVNMSKLTKTNSFYFAPVLGTNPCGELPLSAYGSCCLGSLVLPKFVQGQQTQWKELERVISIAVRFLDNVIDVTTFPTSSMKTVAEDGRRIGLGVMGLADYLFKKEIRYGSEECLLELERLFKFIRNTAYRSSVEIAKEKGPFPKFSVVDYGKASFVRKLPAQLRREIKKYGIRNVALMTCAPTGTTSLVAGVSSGIEPLFSKAYRRRDQISDRIYIHPLYEEILSSGSKVPDWFVDSYDLKPEEHFEVQAVIQSYVDGAISKTINCPKGTTAKKLSEWLLEYAYELKGITVYVDQSRKEQVLYPMTRKEAEEVFRKK